MSDLREKYPEGPDDWFHVTPEKWTTEKCRKAASSCPKDAYGTRGPKGLVPGIKNGPLRYNGGCVHGDVWYKGDVFHKPELPEGFRWEYLPSWGYKLVAA